MSEGSNTQDIEQAARGLIKTLRRSEVATIRKAEKALIDACGGNQDLAHKVQSVVSGMRPDDRLIVGVNGDVAVSPGGQIYVFGRMVTMPASPEDRLWIRSVELSLYRDGLMRVAHDPARSWDEPMQRRAKRCDAAIRSGLRRKESMKSIVERLDIDRDYVRLLKAELAA